MFLEDLKAYLTGKGYTSIFRDTMPDQPDECIGLFLWAHRIPTPNDGSGTRFVQVQVRCMDGDDACRIAGEIMANLDSGKDELKIFLTAERWCIARPLAGPKKLLTEESGRTTYYIEVSLWGSNEP